MEKKGKGEIAILSEIHADIHKVMFPIFPLSLFSSLHFALLHSAKMLRIYCFLPNLSTISCRMNGLGNGSSSLLRIS